MMGIFSNKHATYEMLLTEHIDGVISTADDAKLTLHLATCDACATELREQAQIRTLLQAEPLVAAPRSFALPYAPRTIDTGEPSGITRLLRGMQIATASAAMVLVALVGLTVLDTSPRSAIQQSSAADATAPRSESLKVADGSDGALGPAGAPTEEGSGTEYPPSALPADTTTSLMPAPEPESDAGVKRFDDENLALGLERVPETSAIQGVLQGEFAPEAALAPTAPPADDDRTALEWALLVASLATALLALTVVAVTWRSRRPA